LYEILGAISEEDAEEYALTVMKKHLPSRQKAEGKIVRFRKEGKLTPAAKAVVALTYLMAAWAAFWGQLPPGGARINNRLQAEDPESQRPAILGPRDPTKADNIRRRWRERRRRESAYYNKRMVKEVIIPRRNAEKDIQEAEKKRGELMEELPQRSSEIDAAREEAVRVLEDRGVSRRQIQRAIKIFDKRQQWIINEMDKVNRLTDKFIETKLAYIASYERKEVQLRVLEDDRMSGIDRVWGSMLEAAERNEEKDR
jgi:hypothetical protein